MIDSSHRFVTLIIILLLNPLPFLYGKSIKKLSHQKRQIGFNQENYRNIFLLDKENFFQGLLGCKYDLNVCNEKEICFDDDLFGQCSDGQSLIFKNRLENFNYNQIKALDFILKFLQQNKLQWKDYLTQCILSYVVRFNEKYLQEIYENCLVKNEILNEFEFQKRSNIDSYFNLGRFHLDSTLGVPLFLQFDTKHQSTMHKNQPKKLLLSTNEGHASLVETLQINNNKLLLPSTTNSKIISNDTTRDFPVETNRVFFVINRDIKDEIEGAQLLEYLARINSWPIAIFTELNVEQNIFTFRVTENAYRINASVIVSSTLNDQKFIEKQLAIRIVDAGIGNPIRSAQLSVERSNGLRFALLTLAICVLILFIVSSFVLLFYFKHYSRIRDKFAQITTMKASSTNDYQFKIKKDLSRQHIQSQPTRQSEILSSQSSASSWTEESLTTINMDIMTGHLILSYMEDHLRDRHRLESEWDSLCVDVRNEERAPCSIALTESNERKNRYLDCIPYDHNRIRLTNNYDDEDYINASKITDSDPKCKYIATQGPLPNTTNAFWQMVWEQGSSVIVALSRPIENGMTMCHHYWPVEGLAQFSDFEVNLVSEHIWSDDYVVRSFYLKNLQTMETRTLTQFHYLTWDEFSNPPSVKSILDFRRKVNKCFRARSTPIIVHCNDGVGRTGTYILLDIVLNRIYKGAREINIAATLEHIRDQRAKMVKTKEQFEFVFVVVAEEMTTLLKSSPQ